MPRKLSFAITILALTALLTQTLEAQQTHVVGHILGWTIPPGGPLVYQLWTSFQKFTVGDILVFNFVSGLHTVTRVTKEAYDSCNSVNPIAITAIGPSNFTLDSVGEYYFICSVPAHCPLGQKLAINVTAPYGPTPSLPPLTPLTTTTCRDAVSYVVGDTLGWSVPPDGALAYSAWASPKTFTIGDSLVFNFITGQQDVARVTKEAYDTCNSKNYIKLETAGPTNFRLETVGDYYFIGAMGRQCSLGQKLSVKVTGLTDGRPITYIVGDGLGWLPPPGGALAYSTWTYNKNFVVGDTLVFNFVNKTQDVARVTKSAYENCDTNDTIAVWTTSPARVTLTVSGDHYFTSTYPLLCTSGQKLVINVRAAAAAATTSISPSPEGHSTTPDVTLTPSSSSVRPSHTDGAAFYFTSFSLVLAFFVN